MDEIKKSNYTEEQISFALKQVELGTPISEVCHKLGIAEQTFHRWKSKYDGMLPSDIKRLRQLEEENAKLKMLALVSAAVFTLLAVAVFVFILPATKRNMTVALQTPAPTATLTPIATPTLTATPEAAPEPIRMTSGDYKLLITGEEACIEDYTGNAADLVIPTEVTGYRVTSIGERAFASCSFLTSVTIPEGVISIGFSAFGYCNWLNTITIPASVVTIEPYAFEGCIRLAHLNISVGNISYLCSDGVLFNSDGTLLHTALCALVKGDYVVPDSVLRIENGAFSRCNKLNLVTIPTGVTSIGDAAFWGCENMKSVTISEGVTSLGASVFQCCHSLQSINIPRSMTSIGEAAFGCCESLSITVAEGNPYYRLADGLLLDMDGRLITALNTSIHGIYRVPEELTTLSAFSFSSCERLTSVTIPTGIKSIPESAFGWCKILRSVEIYDGMESIESHAFYQCFGLNSVTIPASVTYISADAFTDCSVDLTIYAPAGSYAEQWANENRVAFVAE